MMKFKLPAGYSNARDYVDMCRLNLKAARSLKKPKLVEMYVAELEKLQLAGLIKVAS